jgi:hypothetical protein
MTAETRHPGPQNLTGYDDDSATVSASMSYPE